jgi:hypothetical protein
VVGYREIHASAGDVWQVITGQPVTEIAISVTDLAIPVDER